MPETTTRYDLPWQEIDDPPDGSGLGQDLAERVEVVLGEVEDKVDAYINGPTRSVITASGTWNKPTGAHRVHVRCIGGGGAGGGAGTTAGGQWSFGDGGGAGEYREGWFDASTFASTVAVTIGAAGTAGTGAGGAGGNTSFGAHMTANGGAGGGVRTSTAVVGFSGVTSNLGGSGGSGGDVAMAGGAGGPGIGLSSTTTFGQIGGAGGASHMSGSQTGRAAGAGAAGRQYGGGGSGAALGGGASAANGGAGAAGVCIVTVYYDTL
jgi:hypothetical protein